MAFITAAQNKREWLSSETKACCDPMKTFLKNQKVPPPPPPQKKPGTNKEKENEGGDNNLKTPFTGMLQALGAMHTLFMFSWLSQEVVTTWSCHRGLCPGEEKCQVSESQCRLGPAPALLCVFGGQLLCHVPLWQLWRRNLKETLSFSTVRWVSSGCHPRIPAVAQVWWEALCGDGIAGHFSLTLPKVQAN